jgi:antitoxin VapB
MPQTAKLFFNGRSQAVRLPQEFRFEGSEVYVRRDPATGDVILSRKSSDWESFFALVDQGGVSQDFMADRDPLEPEREDIF